MIQFNEVKSDYTVPLPEDSKAQLDHNLMMFQSQKIATLNGTVMQQTEQIKQLQEMIMNANQQQAIAKAKGEN